MTSASKLQNAIVAGRTAEGYSEGQLPRAFLEWQSESRIALCRMLLSHGGDGVRTMASHLPVLATRGENGEINLASKGIGLMPKLDKIPEFTALFQKTAASCTKETPRLSLGRRADTLMAFYSDIHNFDDSMLGGLEIFEGTTFSNLRRDSRASLLFTGEAPRFYSFQLDGTVRFVSEGDPHYDFLLAARELFARDEFHVHQAHYPHGFLFKVRSVREKRPFSRL